MIGRRGANKITASFLSIFKENDGSPIGLSPLPPVLTDGTNSLKNSQMPNPSSEPLEALLNQIFDGARTEDPQRNKIKNQITQNLSNLLHFKQAGGPVEEGELAQAVLGPLWGVLPFYRLNTSKNRPTPNLYVGTLTSLDDLRKLHSMSAEIELMRNRWKRLLPHQGTSYFKAIGKVGRTYQRKLNRLEKHWPHVSGEVFTSGDLASGNAFPTLLIPPIQEVRVTSPPQIRINQRE